MAALEFPTSPSDGEEFGNFIWDAENNVWNYLPPSGPTFPFATVSATTGSPTTGSFTDSNDIEWNYYKFTGTGSITFDTPGYADILVVGGGGGTVQNGSYRATGGAGAVKYGMQYVEAGTNSIAIGGGGSGLSGQGGAGSGGATTFGSIYAGGGEGGYTVPGNTGGSKSAPYGGGGGRGLALSTTANTRYGGGAGSSQTAGIELNYEGSTVTYGTTGVTVVANTGSGGTLGVSTGASGVVIVKVQA